MHQEAWSSTSNILIPRDGMSYNNLGFIYEDQGNYIGAIKSYMSCCRRSDSVGDKKAVADVLSLSVLYMAWQERFCWRLKNYASRIKFLPEMGYKHGIAIRLPAHGRLSTIIDFLKLSMTLATRSFDLFER